MWNFVGRCALQRRASCAWAFEWVSWCRFVSVGAVCHGSCILHREDNRPHTVQADCLRPTSILGLLAVCSLRADKQAQFATRRLFISLKNMLLDVGNLRRSQLNNPVSQSSRPLGAVFEFWKVHFLKTALLEKVQFVFRLGHHACGLLSTLIFINSPPSQKSNRLFLWIPRRAFAFQLEFLHFPRFSVQIPRVSNFPREFL